MQAQDSPPPKRRKFGLLLRVLIYGPLLGFFGWQAAQRNITERRIADDNFRAGVEQWLMPPPRTIMLPNGELMPVYEMTEEEAVQKGLLPAPESAPEPESEPQ